MGNPLLPISHIAWMTGGPGYSRIASRLEEEGEARLLSLLLLVLPGHILPYYGDERMMKDLFTQDSARMIFDEKDAGTKSAFCLFV